jgi:hypothetical protein
MPQGRAKKASALHQTDKEVQVQSLLYSHNLNIGEYLKIINIKSIQIFLEYLYFYS